MNLIIALISGLGSVVGGLFKFKEAQANTVSSAIKVLSESGNSDAQYSLAAAQAISALYSNGPLIERIWRPTFMWIAMALIVSRWFGFVPPHISPEEVSMVYSFLEIGLIGYMPLRSIDKWMKGFQIGSILKTFIEKKIM